MKSQLLAKKEIIDYNKGILYIVPSHGRDSMQGKRIVRDFLLDLYSYKSFETLSDLDQTDKENLAGLIMQYSQEFDVDPTEAWGNHDKTSYVASLLSTALIKGDKYSNSVFVEDIKKMFSDYYHNAMESAVEDAMQEIESGRIYSFDDHHDYSDLPVTVSSGRG